VIDPASLLSNIPFSLRQELVSSYDRIVQNYVERRWEPAELNGGKFCEVVYSILSGALAGKFPDAASKPKNLADACRGLESQPADLARTGDRSLRILIPRLLPFLYEIRNNRGVGHVGGDVDPNHEDAEAVLSMTTWIMAELVRIFHGVSLSVAQSSVDSLVQRRHPLVWSTDEVKRVLDPSLKTADQALVLLYSESSWVQVHDLASWVEYSSKSMFEKRVLAQLHKNRFIEFDRRNKRARISPSGTKKVEDELLRR
jgi:hypothetical protein